MQAISPSKLSNSNSHTATALLIHRLFSYELKIGIEIPVSSSIQIPATAQGRKKHTSRSYYNIYFHSTNAN